MACALCAHLPSLGCLFSYACSCLPLWLYTCSSCTIPMNYPLPTPQRSQGSTEVTRKALFLLKVFFSPFFSFFPPLFSIFSLCLSPSPAVCLGFASLKDVQIKSSSFFQILSPNHPSASSSHPILLADLWAAQGESASISIFNKELLGRDGSGWGGGKGRGIGS